MLKDAPVNRFPYKTDDPLRQHLANFVATFYFARRLKTLKGLTPCELICKCWTKTQRFKLNPPHQALVLYS
jgi:hypothetical protein